MGAPESAIANVRIGIWEFPKIRGPYFRVTIIRILLFRAPKKKGPLFPHIPGNPLIMKPHKAGTSS